MLEFSLTKILGAFGMLTNKRPKTLSKKWKCFNCDSHHQVSFCNKVKDPAQIKRNFETQTATYYTVCPPMDPNWLKSIINILLLVFLTLWTGKTTPALGASNNLPMCFLHFLPKEPLLLSLNQVMNSLCSTKLQVPMLCCVPLVFVLFSRLITQKYDKIKTLSL